MKTSDLVLSILILIIFFALFFSSVLGIGLKNIENNWPIYRCNPAVMPFAGFFNQDVTSNFTYCIQNMQTLYMGNLLNPLNYTQGLLGNIVSELTNAIQAVRAFFNKIRNFISEIVTSIMNVFLNILISVQLIIIYTVDLFHKLIGATFTLGHMVRGSNDTSESIWRGPPGETLRAVGSVCFHPDTLVKKKNNTFCKMCELEVGDILKNNSVVRGTMILSNLDDNNKYIEDLYLIPNGECKNEIIVSGSHLIYDKSMSRFIHVKDSHLAKKCDINVDKLNCLITSDHIICLGKNIFHDWEDNNGSKSKNV
jgi:hypothetical protein